MLSSPRATRPDARSAPRRGETGRAPRRAAEHDRGASPTRAPATRAGRRGGARTPPGAAASAAPPAPAAENPNSASYVLRPASLSMRLILNEAMLLEHPRLQAEVDLDGVHLQLSRAQYDDAVALEKAVRERRRIEAFRAARPARSVARAPRAGWRHAVRCVRAGPARRAGGSTAGGAAGRAGPAHSALWSFASGFEPFSRGACAFAGRRRDYVALWKRAEAFGAAEPVVQGDATAGAASGETPRGAPQDPGPRPEPTPLDEAEINEVMRAAGCPALTPCARSSIRTRRRPWPRGRRAR